LNQDFWRGKRVFVTGHTGFKGSWLVLLLQSLGARVAGYALPPPTEPSLYALARVGDGIESTTGDIRDLGQLERAMHAFEPEVVLHLAAQSIVLHSYDDPVNTYSTNVVGTVHVLEAVRHLKRPCTVVNVTTDKCYDNKGWVWGYRESDSLGGHDPYSNSKACAELVGQCYRDSFFPPARWAEHGVGIASARAGNVIGGGDWTPRQLVPEAVAAFALNKPVQLRHPDAVRPWQHVLDCLAGYLRLAEALAGDGVRHAGEWNFGPTETELPPVAALVEALSAQWGLSRPWQHDPADHASEEAVLRLDVSKATHRLGWSPRLPIAEAIGWAASWYRAFHGGGDARQLCLAQIERFAAVGPG
jgi:CDP-glucose 4,6-dehydratase